MREAIDSIGIGLVGLLAIGCADIGYSLAVAGETMADPARFAYEPGDSDVLANTEPYELRAAHDEYSLTPTGSIIPMEPSGTLRRRIAGSSRGGVLFGSLTPEYERPDEAESAKHIGNKLSIGAVECGPSPLTANEIRELVAGAALRHGVDQDLAIAVVSVESGFDRNRNSPKGARGPMQLMPGTADRFGVSDPCEPTGNIDAGIRYLALLLAEFKNPMLAIAAYNAGEDRIYEYGGIPPFPETVSYVAKVVNHQLGLPMPRPDRARGRHRTAKDELSERGVVMTDKRRQWVAGVMQF